MEALNQKVKPDFSSDLKKELCLKWEKSGLKKVAFAKLNKINKSTFYSWFTEKEKKTAGSKKSDKINWLPVNKGQGSSLIEKQDEILIELSLPNHIMIRVKVRSQKAVSFIQELSHAAAVIW